MSRQSIGGVLCVVAAVLTLVGSFQTAFSVEFGLPVQGQGGAGDFALTSWGMPENEDTRSFGGIGDFAAVVGVPLLVAAVILLAAAMLGARRVPWVGNPRVTRATGPVALAGAAFLTGVVTTFGTQLAAWDRLWTDAVGRASGMAVDTSLGPGFWLLVTAVALAVAAVVLIRRPEQPIREEPDTPVLGFPAVSRLPDEPPEQ